MISFDNTRYFTGSYYEFADYVLRKVTNNSDKKVIVVHINLRNLYYLNRDPSLKEKIDSNCLVVFDGIGMKAGLWLKGYGFLPDLNGTDLFPHLMKKISGTTLGVFLLGGSKRVIEKAVDNIISGYPDLLIKGSHHGYFSPNEEPFIIEKINNSKSDILIIGRGFPLQENFVLKYEDKLNVSMVWNVGGLFDFISGYKRRAPLFLRKMRLEWLFRFLLEPRRMLYRNTVCAFWSLSYIILNKRTA